MAQEQPESLIMPPPVSTEAPSGELSATVLLENMSRALRERAFKISLIHLQANHIQPLVYIHGRIDEREVAFLERLNGPPKNAVRIDNTVTFIEHGQSAYSVHANRIQGLIPSSFAGDIARLQSGYQFVLGGRSRIAGRPSQLVRVIPNDEYRYGYQLWLDLETYLPLRYEMITTDKQALEQLLVVELLVLDEAPAILLEVMKQQWPAVAAQLNRNNGNNWQLSWIPEGFKVIAKDHHRLMGLNEHVEYIAMSDGLANISVYITNNGETVLPEEIVTRNGISMVSKQMGSIEIIAIGQVPSPTLFRIASSVNPLVSPSQ